MLIGLDPTSSIFTMGKTAALVGHTLQPLLNDLLDERQLRSKRKDEEDESVVCRPASLLLIDRSCDMFSPSQHDGTGPLAHRILSMLPRQAGSNLCSTVRGGTNVSPLSRTPRGSELTDIALLQEPVRSLGKKLHQSVSDSSAAHTATHELLIPLVSKPNTIAESGGDVSSSSVLLSPMSAVSQLSLPLQPSIAPPFQGPLDDSTCDEVILERNAQFMHTMFAQSEERGRDVLGGALRELGAPELKIEDESAPRKSKKGLGAEMLALVSDATACRHLAVDGQNDGPGALLPYRPDVLHENPGLLSWALAVIEAMQRSSGKQLTAHLCKNGAGHSSDRSSNLVGRASFELRAQREGDALARLLNGGKLTASRVVQVIMEVCGLQPLTESESIGDEVAASVKDIKHTMMLALRYEEIINILS